MFTDDMLLFSFATALTVVRAWRETDIGPWFLTGLSIISLWGIFWSIDDLLNFNFLAEAEEIFIGWKDVTNILSVEFSPPDFGHGALEQPNHQLVIEWIGALVRYGAIWLFFAYFGL